MSGYISKLIESVLLGFQDAENKILEYLLLKGSYIQPLRLALHISKKNSESALFNTLTPFLLDTRFLFDKEFALPNNIESKSIPMSIERISTDSIVLPTGIIENVHHEQTRLVDKIISPSESLEPTPEVMESGIVKVTNDSPNSEIGQIQDKITKKKKEKKKKKVDWVENIDNSPFIIWLQHQKSLDTSRKQKKTKKSNKFIKIQESAQKSITPSNEIISEPLARLLASQGHWLEAKKMYKSLMIRFPELSEAYKLEIKEINKRIDPGKG